MEEILRNEFFNKYSYVEYIMTPDPHFNVKRFVATKTTKLSLFMIKYQLLNYCSILISSRGTKLLDGFIDDYKPNPKELYDTLIKLFYEHTLGYDIREIKIADAYNMDEYKLKEYLKIN